MIASFLVFAACSSEDEVVDAVEDQVDAVEGAVEDTDADMSGEETDEDMSAEVGEPTGDPIKIMVTGTIESPAFSIPSTPVGAELAIAEINAAGGVNGRPLELVICDDELDPNVAAGCIQQAVEEEVVSLVGGLSVFEPLVVPVLNDAGIPWIGMATASDFSTPILFPIAADGVSAFSAIGFAAVEHKGCETPAVFISAQGSQDNTDAISAGVEAAGGTVSSTHQGTGPDFAPLVESALAEGADCIASGVSPPETAGLVTAIAGRVPLVTLDGPLPVELAATLGEAVEGTTIVGGHRLAAAGDPDVVALQEASMEQNPDITIDNFWVHGYVGVKMIAQILEGADDVSAATVLAGLSTLTDFDTGFGSTIDYSTPNSAEGYERIFNTNMFLYEIENGEYKIVEGVTFDMQPAIDLLAAG